MKWSEQFAKERIDQNVFEIEDGVSKSEKKIIEELQFYCEGVFDNQERIKRTKKKVLSIKNSNQDLDNIDLITDDILDELDEISDDLQFSQSRRGSFISFVNNYGQEVYKELRTNDDFENLFIGSHIEKDIILVSGTLKKHEQLLTAIEIISKYPTTFPINYKVVVGG